MSVNNRLATSLGEIPQQCETPRKSDRTRRDILDRALEFLWTHPFRDLTVAGLMSSTDVGRSAFYQYFPDLHHLMETLLQGMKDDIFEAAQPWFEGEGDAIALLKESLSSFVNVCYTQGPIVRAVVDAAASDARLECAWASFMKDFDDAVTARIEQQQAAGLIAKFEAHPVAVALNRMDAGIVIENFGRRPRGNREAVLAAITRVWTSTLYGNVTFE